MGQLAPLRLESEFASYHCRTPHLTGQLCAASNYRKDERRVSFPTSLW